MGSVLVLNAGYEPLHRVSYQHAIRMLVREVAVVEESVEGATFAKKGSRLPEEAGMSLKLKVFEPTWWQLH